MKNCTMIIPKTTSSLIQELFKEFPLKKLENYSEIEEKIKEIRDSSEDEIQVTKTKLEEEAIRSQKEKLNGQRNIQTYYGIAAINKISKLQSLLGRSIRLALLHPKLWKEKINFNTKDNQEIWENIIKETDATLIQKYKTLHLKEAKENYRKIKNICFAFGTALLKAQDTTKNMTKDLALAEYNEVIELVGNKHHTLFVSAQENFEDNEETNKDNPSMIITKAMEGLAKTVSKEKENKNNKPIRPFQRRGSGHGRGRGRGWRGNNGRGFGRNNRHQGNFHHRNNRQFNRNNNW